MSTTTTETRKLPVRELRALIREQIATFERYRHTRTLEGYTESAHYFAGRIDSLEAILRQL